MYSIHRAETVRDLLTFDRKLTRHIFWDINPRSPLEIYFATCFTLVSSLDYFSTLKVEAKCSSDTSVGFQRGTRRYILEHKTLPNYRCVNLKF
jgi:hypothetical protein